MTKTKIMWFLNDVTIRIKGKSESEVLSICKDIGIKVGGAYHKNKWLGKVISDDDYPKLIKELENKNNLNDKN